MGAGCWLVKRLNPVQADTGSPAQAWRARAHSDPTSATNPAMQSEALTGARRAHQDMIPSQSL
jgi:hypothetical protein